MADFAEAGSQIVRLVTRWGVTRVTDEVHGRLIKRTLPSGQTETAYEYDDLPPLPDLGEDVQIGDTLGAALRQEGDEPPPAAFPDDLFAGVVGLEYERRMLRYCVLSDRPQSKHALLWGPPGSAKSLLLDCLRTLPSARRVSELSRPGLRKLVLEQMGGEGVLLIDEVDKCDREAQDALLTLMDGNIESAVVGATHERRVDIHVIAAANDPTRLTAPLRDRFIELRIPDATVSERAEIITGVLRQRHALAEEEAQAIAAIVAPHSASLRDAEQLAQVRASDPELAEKLSERLRGAPAPAIAAVPAAPTRPPAARPRPA